MSHTLAAPNQALEPTPNSLRSCVASAIGRGSPRAFGFKRPVALGEQVYSILSEYPAEYPAILDIATSLSLNKLLGLRNNEDTIREMVRRLLCELWSRMQTYLGGAKQDARL